MSTTTMNSARVVPSAEGFRANAEEHLGWARTAYTDREREIFVKMARAWLEAASRAEERTLLSEPSPTRPDEKIGRFGRCAAVP